MLYTKQLLSHVHHLNKKLLCLIPPSLIFICACKICHDYGCVWMLCTKQLLCHVHHLNPSENQLYLYQFTVMSSQYNAACCKSFICFVSYTITLDFKTVKLVFSTMCFPKMDCPTGCIPLLNTKTLLDT